MSEPRNERRLTRSRRRRYRRRRRLAALVGALALVVAIPLLLGGLRAEVGPLETLHSRVFGGLQAASSKLPGGGGTGEEQERARSASVDSSENTGKGGQPEGGEEESPEPSPVQSSPAAATYAVVAPGLPGAEPSSVGGTSQSTDDPAWAVTEVEAPSRDGAYTVYSKKVGDGWEARHSVLANDPDYPRKGRSPLVDLPEDLRDDLYAESTVAPAESPEAVARELAAESPYLGEGWRPVNLRGEDGFAKVRLQDGDGAHTHAYLRRYEGSWYAVGLGRALTAAELPDFPDDLVEPGSLPEAGPAMVPVAEPVLDNVPRDRREEVEDGLGEVRETVEGYEGTFGVHVVGSGEDWSYGIRPDERFYTASVIKVPIMAAVYRKVEAGELSLDETVATEARDYAGGAGSLQWQEESVSHTVGDYLWMMMTESDNVATNVLVRAVGGPEYVNEVARDLGAEGTALRQKVTDQRAAVPELDNYTTPRDMAVVMESIATGDAANEEHTEQMLGMMREKAYESWAGKELPSEADPACKVGWIGGVYNDVCLVQSESGPYVVSIFSKYGPPAVAEGSEKVTEISNEVWEIQDGKKDDEDDKEEPEDQPDEEQD